VGVIHELPSAPPIVVGHAPRDMLLDAADANFAVHVAWAAASTDGMRVSEQVGVVLTDSGLGCDTFNVACRARLAAHDAQRCVRDAVDFYRQSGRPFSWWVGPLDTPDDLGGLLRAEGLRDLLHIHGLAEDEAGVVMAADLGALPDLDTTLAGLEIRAVETETSLRQYAAHFADAHVSEF
jgi:hypothetical protein